MEISRNWRLRQQRYRLEGTECPACGHLAFPPRDICIKCGDDSPQPRRLIGRGRIYSFTVLHQGPDSFDGSVPYAVGLIDLEEGPRITAMLTDVSPDDIAIGMQVQMVVRVTNTEGDRGPINYSYKFRPLLEPES